MNALSKYLIPRVPEKLDQRQMLVRHWLEERKSGDSFGGQRSTYQRKRQRQPVVPVFQVSLQSDSLQYGVPVMGDRQDRWKGLFQN